MTEYILDILRGTYPYFSIPAAVVVIYRWKTGKISDREKLLLICLFVLFGGMLLQILIADRQFYVSRRYLLPFSPLLFGFSAWGVLFLKKKFRISRRWIFLGMVILTIATYMDALYPIIKDRARPKRKQELEEFRQMAQFIKQDFKKPRNHLTFPRFWHNYHPGKEPVLYGSDYFLSYLCRGTTWMEGIPLSFCNYRIERKTEKEIESEASAFESKNYRIYRMDGTGKGGGLSYE